MSSPAVVYVIGEPGGAPVKIGYSASRAGVEIRRGYLQCGNPRRLGVLAMISGGRRLEAALHRHFRDHRVRGEWFACSVDDVCDAAGAWAIGGEARLREMRSEAWMDRTAAAFDTALAPVSTDARVAMMRARHFALDDD
jgi:hypothetical protein